MKKILAFLLAGCVLFSLSACGSTPAPETPTEPEPVSEPIPEPAQSAGLTRADLEKAVVEMGWAYGVKGASIQYDSQELTEEILGKYFTGSYRISQDAAPEFGTDETTIYSVCSDFVQKAYLYATGQTIFGASIDWTTTCMWLDCENVAGTGEDICILRYKNPELYPQLAYVQDGRADERGVTAKHDVDEAGLKAFLENWEENLRPGDVLLPEGHAMLYIGEGRVIDCTGSKYSMETGKDAPEATGAVAQTLYEMSAYISVSGKFNVVPGAKKPREWFLVVRPIDLLVTDDGDGDPANDPVREGVEIPAPIYSRERYPAMDIRRSADIGAYGTAVQGETITYTVKIANNSLLTNYKTFRRLSAPDYAGEHYENLTVTETVPDGTELVSVSDGGTADGKTITWTADIPAGETKEFSYTVKVTAAPGETVVCGGGFVADIPSNTLSNPVGYAGPDEAALAALLDFSSAFSAWESKYGVTASTDVTEFARSVYEKVMGLRLELPDADAMFREVYTMQHIGPMQGLGYRYRETSEAWMYTPSEADTPLNRMRISGFYGGKGTWFAEDSDRMNEFSIGFVSPGDLIFRLTLSDYAGSTERTVTGADVAVYLGNSRFAVCSSTGELCMESSAAFLYTSFLQDAFFALRPSQAGALAAIR